jgi:tetratricopeptide (TPR) repeat protein
MKITFRVCVGLVCWYAMAAALHAQEVEALHVTADPNSAVIQGRVLLPSGFAAERFARITLKNSQSVLSTIYTNKSGEFHIRNLSQGFYFVQAEIPDGSYEPVTKRVELGRGLMVDLTLQLGEKKSLQFTRLSARVVSAAELQQSVPPAAKKEYAQGLKFVSKGNFPQAAAHFETAVSIYPSYLAARNDLGAQYLKLKRLDEAEKHFQIVLENDGKNFNAKFNMGLVHIERRDYLGGIAQLNQAMAIDSTRAVAHLWIGIASLEMGNLQDAELELTKALVMGAGECVAAHYHLARVQISRGDVAAASRSLQAYLEEAPRGEYAEEAKKLDHQLKKK